MHADAVVLRSKWAAGRPVAGPFVQLPAVGEIEIFAIAGFDFVIVDLEHGAINLETAENMMRAAHAHGVAPFVRVLANRPECITGALNIGAAGVLVPHVTGFESARAAVSATKFGPAGTRSVCPFVRSAHYSASKSPAYYTDANASVIAGVLLEGKEALSELHDILQIPELDIILIAPYDLSQSLGVTGETTHPRVVNAVEEACRKAAGHGKIIGFFVEDPERAAEWAKRGVMYLALDVDAQILYRASRSMSVELTRHLQEHYETTPTGGRG